MPDPTPNKPVKVEQVDRDAAADLAEWLIGAQKEWEGMPIFFASDFPTACRDGVWDEHDWVQAFARHRPSASRLPGGDVVERVALLKQRATAMREDLYTEARNGNVINPFGTGIPDLLGELIAALTELGQEPSPEPEAKVADDGRYRLPAQPSGEVGDLVAAMDFAVGERVRKLKGYAWPGVVVSVFKTISGATRVVVECTVPEVAGALHIYSPEQLERVL